MSIMQAAFAKLGILPTERIVSDRWAMLKIVVRDEEGQERRSVSGPCQEVELYVSEWKTETSWNQAPNITWMEENPRRDRSRVLLVRQKG